LKKPSNQAFFMSNTEVVVIGSGIGGLSCAALLARYGIDVTVVESHSIAGGAAHAFERNGCGC
jgi:phytoene dehydrogenase-like protein